MKFCLLTIAVLLFIPTFAGAQFYYLIDSFDTLPDTASGGGYGWYTDGAGEYTAPYIDATISTDNKQEGTGAMRVDWQIPDPRDMTPEEFRGVRDLIERKVKDLIAALDESS